MNKQNNDYLSKNQPEGEPDFDKVNRLTTNLNTQPSPLPESVEELVRDAAKVEMGVSYEPHMSQIDESFIDGAIFGAKYHQTHHSAEVERLKRLLAELADINSTSPYHQELRLRAFEALKEIEK